MKNIFTVEMGDRWIKALYEVLEMKYNAKITYDLVPIKKDLQVEPELANQIKN